MFFHDTETWITTSRNRLLTLRSLLHNRVIHPSHSTDRLLGTWRSPGGPIMWTGIQGRAPPPRRPVGMWKSLRRSQLRCDSWQCMLPGCTMSIPEKVVAFLRKNKGSYYCASCLAKAILTRGHAVGTIQETLGLCNGFTAHWGPCPACQSGRSKNLIMAN